MAYLEEYSGVIEYDGDWYDATLSELEFEDEPAQKGGIIDPSWDAFSTLETCEATIVESEFGLLVSGDLKDTIKEIFEEKHEELICDKLKESYQE